VETIIFWSIYLVTQLSIAGKLLLRMAEVMPTSKQIHVRAQKATAHQTFRKIVY
jgi:hypothetical protein